MKQLIIFIASFIFSVAIGPLPRKRYWTAVAAVLLLEFFFHG